MVSFMFKVAIVIGCFAALVALPESKLWPLFVGTGAYCWYSAYFQLLDFLEN